jgi:hypothetical protein
MKRIYVILIVLVVIILLAGAGVYWYSFLRPHKNILKTRPAYVLSSTQLVSEFSDDENAANEKYAGEIIEIAGRIVDVKKGHKQTAVILEDLFSGISVYLDSSYVVNNPEKINDLDDEQTITIRGQCDGMLTDIIISRAVIIQ